MELTPKSWKMFAVILLLSLPCVVSQRCPKGTDLLMTTGECMAPLEEYITMSLNGNLNLSKKRQACREYDESVACVKKYVEACRRLELDDLPQVQLVLDDLKGGFGKLCENKEYFERYSSHTVCYRNVQSETSRCREKIDDIFAAEDSTSSDDHSAEINSPICNIVKEIHDCNNQAILYSGYAACSEDAANLFEDLVEHEIPSLMIPHCNLSTTPSPSTVQVISGHRTVQFDPCLAVFTAVSGLITLLETIYGNKLV